MAGKFINTQYTNAVESIVSTVKTNIQNPFYLYTDKKSTVVDYYNLNNTKSTLDESSNLAYSSYEGNSGLKYNVIRGFMIFGLGGSIGLNYDNGDYGIEATPIEEEAFIMPNTIVPYEGDMIVISYLKEKLIFRVNEVQKDTLDTGANVYKISIKTFSTETVESLEKQVVKEFSFISKNVGSNFNCLLESTEYDTVSTLEGLLSTLANYYKELFFDSKVQTFVFEHNGELHYDPYMIEFCIRNGIFDYGDEYLYITHQAMVPKTFSINYSKTFFNAIEEKRPDKFTRIFADARAICDVCSLFWMRSRTYFQLEYNTTMMDGSKVMCFDGDVVSHIKKFEYYDSVSDKNYFYNILIAYMNNDNDYLRDNIIGIINNLDYKENIEYFYAIPIFIYIISRYINGIMTA